MTFTSHVDEVGWLLPSQSDLGACLLDPARRRLLIRKNDKLIKQFIFLLSPQIAILSRWKKAAFARKMPFAIERCYVNDLRVHSMPSANVVQQPILRQSRRLALRCHALRCVLDCA